MYDRGIIKQKFYIRIWVYRWTDMVLLYNVYSYWSQEGLWLFWGSVLKPYEEKSPLEKISY